MAFYWKKIGPVYFFSEIYQLRFLNIASIIAKVSQFPPIIVAYLATL